MSLTEAMSLLPAASVLLLFCLFLALGFEVINGFHDTANAVTTVIYTRSLPAGWAVVYSGCLNFLGVIVGGTAVAFGIVNLLPAAVIENDDGTPLLIMVASLLSAAVLWNLGTWFVGLPVSSSHTLIGSIVGVAIANSLASTQDLSGVNWDKAKETAFGLFLAPVIGFTASALLLLLMKAIVRVPRLYVPPVGDDKPPLWIRGILVFTCGSVSYAHGSNDGQKGMGLVLLVLLGFLPVHYSLSAAGDATQVTAVVERIRELRPIVEEAKAGATGDKAKVFTKTAQDLALVEAAFAGKSNFHEVPDVERREVRKAILRIAKVLKDSKNRDFLADPTPTTATPAPVEEAALAARKAKTLKTIAADRAEILAVAEHVPLWVVICTALALGFGTMFGYKRIVETVAHKIGKTELTYAQGAAAETIAAITIQAASIYALPVSTTQVVTSGIAGTMVANGSGVQRKTLVRILLAWVFTLPATMMLAGVFYACGRAVFG